MFQPSLCSAVSTHSLNILHAFLCPCRPRGSSKATQAIQALNPYNSSWTIKARVASKGQLRSFTRNGSACSVFSAELIDDQVCRVQSVDSKL